jgi:putative transposase
VVQRGNNREDVFFVDDDRRAYLEFLRDHCARFGFSILGYCLMTNHIHLVGTPGSEDSLAKAVGRTHFRYSQYVNRLHRRSGHLWQNRFHSCSLDKVHMWRALCYVERNPVRAKLVRVAWRYQWSSAASHATGVDPTGLLDMPFWFKSWRPERWKSELKSAEDQEWTAAIKLSTSRGRPLAGDSFLSKLERRLGRKIRPLPVGRPKERGSTGHRNNQGQNARNNR